LAGSLLVAAAAGDPPGKRTMLLYTQVDHWGQLKWQERKHGISVDQQQTTTQLMHKHCQPADQSYATYCR